MTHKPQTVECSVSCDKCDDEGCPKYVVGDDLLRRVRRNYAMVYDAECPYSDDVICNVIQGSELPAALTTVQTELTEAREQARLKDNEIVDLKRNRDQWQATANKIRDERDALTAQVATLREALAALATEMEAEMDEVYGTCCARDPRDFTPDEDNAPEEIAAWKVACERAEKGEQDTTKHSETIQNGQATRVSRNLSLEADSFNIARRLTVINQRTDSILFQMEGNFSINKASDGDLDVVGEDADGRYYKHFVCLSSEITYIVEDLGATHVDKHKYQINFNPKMIIPVTPVIID